MRRTTRARAAKKCPRCVSSSIFPYVLCSYLGWRGGVDGVGAGCFDVLAVFIFVCALDSQLDLPFMFLARVLVDGVVVMVLC